VTIFVSVASYRDPELVPTVRDCIAKARHPEDLRFGVNWQRGGDEDISAIAHDPRVRVVEFDWRASRGACWARAEVMKLYDGEDHFLQFDSHTRFAPDWDVRLLAHAAATGADKPIITGYPPTYEPGGAFEGVGEPAQIVCDRFTDEGIPLFRQQVIPGWRGLDRPPRARFLAAGFLFAPGSFVREVPYDPRIYFTGEEITLAVRAYTWGYDLFHLHEVLAWHYYIREDQPKHWTDHTDPAAGTAWWQHDRASRRRVVTLLRHPSIGRLGSGPVRTVREYEAYAGIDFRRSTNTPEALIGTEPAVPDVRETAPFA
jgi:glycosyltransferase involved in cell wall biosynthesis